MVLEDTTMESGLQIDKIIFINDQLHLVMDIVMAMDMAMAMDMVDMEDISMESAHLRILPCPALAKEKLKLTLDMAMDTAMAMDWEAMAMGTLMATVMAMVAMVDTVDISMENEHQKICLKMVSVKGKPRLMPDMVLGLAMVLGMVMDMDMVKDMGMVMDTDMERDRLMRSK